MFPVDVFPVFPVYQMCFLYLGTAMFITPERCLFITPVTPEVDVNEVFEIPDIDVSDVPEIFDVPDVFDVPEVYLEMLLRCYIYVMLSI